MTEESEKCEPGMCGGKEPWWVRAAQTLGVVTIAFFFMMYWANNTIEWEREQMIPAITKSAQSADQNTEALNRIERVLVRLNDHPQDQRALPQ